MGKPKEQNAPSTIRVTLETRRLIRCIQSHPDYCETSPYQFIEDAMRCFMQEHNIIDPYQKTT